MLLRLFPNNLKSMNQVESFIVKTNFNLQGDCLVWYVSPQLFFNCQCTLCPTGTKGTLYSASHKEVSTVYFSSIEPINLTQDSSMQQAEVSMLYDSTSNQRLSCLYICPFASVLGSASLIQCFISGQLSPHYCTQLQGRSGSWKSLCRHTVGLGQQQQALQG